MPGCFEYVFLMNSQIENRPLAEIGQTYSSLRLVDPKADAAIASSMEQYGQLSPIVCVKTPQALELLDGFKRLRAAHTLKYETIRLLLLETSQRAGKAGMIRFNRIAKTITDLEEALILRSLYHDEGMNQEEIGALVGHDKSWVSRRLSLVERMHEEVWKSLELGLICVSVARELARLPRGNQSEVLAKVLKYGLGKRDVEKVVRCLLDRPPYAHAVILNNLQEFLVSDPRPAETSPAFFRQLSRLESFHHSILAGTIKSFMPENEGQVSLVRSVIESGHEVAKQLRNLLQDKEEF